jgi:phage gpG-like protein
MLSSLQAGGGNGQPDPYETIHKRFAVKLQQWSDLNFRRGGSPRWKPLSPNTIAQRRQGSSLALRDRGQLQQSMQTAYDGTAANLYSRDKRSAWHHYGTGPYIIRPKNGKFLAFQVAGGVGNAMFGVRNTIAITRTTRGGKRQTKNVKVFGYRGIGPGEAGNAMFVREVHHPGLTARPLLPSREQVWSEIDPVKIAGDFIQEVTKRA